MGCQSSIGIFQPKQFDNKAVIWFLGGGPGSPKQQVSQFLAERYKFKYLSMMELIHFQESAGSPQSAQIRKAMQEKAELSSNLILRVLQKVVVLYGPRKYLIDNFPRNMQDVAEFEALCNKHKEVQFQAYLQLHLQEAQMKDSGMKALGQIKKDAPAEEIEKEVRTIIESYRGKSKVIMDHYQNKQKLMKAFFPNSDPQKTIDQVEQLLAARQVRPVNLVPFFCLDGNEQKEVYSFGLRLARICGFKYWSMSELKQEFSSRPQIAKYLAQTKEDDIDGNFLAQLIRRKLEKYNYKGKYLISGFPRNQKDVGALSAKFNRQILFTAYAGCLHTPATQKEKESFGSLHKFLSLDEEMQSVLINSTESSFAAIRAHMSQRIPKILPGNAKIVLFPTFQSEGSDYFKKMEEFCSVTDFDESVASEVRQQKFTSQLLNSCLSLKKPVPSYLAGNIFASLIEQPGQQQQQQQSSKVQVLKSFPQDIEQFKVVLSRSESISVLCGMFVEPSRIRKNIKSPNEAALASYEKLCSVIEASCDKCFKISEKTTYQEVKAFICSL